MTKSIWIDGWQCRDCRQIYDSVEGADNCCKDPDDISSNRIKTILGLAPERGALKGLQIAITHRIKKMS